MLERLRMDHLCFLQERKKQKWFGKSAILEKPFGSSQRKTCVIVVLHLDLATLLSRYWTLASVSHAADIDMEMSFFKIIAGYQLKPIFL